MTRGIIGKKLGMTQIFNENGQVVPVTVIQAGPCVVVQRKFKSQDGYEAIQVGLVDPAGAKNGRISKAEVGHCAKYIPGQAAVRVIREFKVDPSDPLQPGDSIVASQFAAGNIVHVTGTSKGKGFAGVMKRHHFKGGRASHGSMFHRAPGSIGGSSYPSRVWPGMRMGGQMGSEQVTVQNLLIAKVDAENNLLLIKGAVPGPKGGYVVIKIKVEA